MDGLRLSAPPGCGSLAPMHGLSRWFGGPRDGILMAMSKVVRRFRRIVRHIQNSPTTAAFA
jgi:hypothetical protein